MVCKYACSYLRMYISTYSLAHAGKVGPVDVHVYSYPAAIEHMNVAWFIGM